MSELQRVSLFKPEFAKKMHERIDLRSRMAMEEFAKRQWKLNHPDGFSGHSIQELRRIGHKIADSKTIWDVYDILGESSSVGPCYYDVIIGPQHKRAYNIMDSILSKMEPLPVESALDIATGTGEMALILGKRAHHLTAIDLTPALMHSAENKLKNAHKKGHIGNYSLHIMDVLDLNLPEESVDIAMANGLQAYLSQDEILVMMQQIHRVLKKNGRYYEYQADNPNPPEYKTSQRAMLVGEIAAAIVGQTFTRQNSRSDQKLHLPGFEVNALKIQNKNDPRNYTELLLQCIKK